MDGKFPSVPLASQIDVFALDAIPERRLCSIEGQKNAEEFISALSQRYPDRWHEPKPVSLAPSYRILIGPTEILVLKLGIAISTNATGSGKEIVVHHLKLGEAEDIVRAACKSAEDAE
jgi:hypothetical protein